MRRSNRTWSIPTVVVIVGCGRSLVTLDDGAGDASDTGGRSGASNGGAAGTATTGGGTTATDGGTTATGGSASGRGGVGGTERGGTSNAGAGDGGQGPDNCDVDEDGVMSHRCGGEDCEDEDPNIPDPDDSNAETGRYWGAETMSEVRGGSGLAVDADGVAHVAFTGYGQIRYFVGGEIDEILLADVNPTSEVLMALDSDREPRLLFGGAGSPVTLAVRRGSSWQVTELDSDGFPVSIVAGPNDETIVGYLVYPLGQGIRYGTDRSGSLELDTLVGPMSAALAVAPGGELHLAWQGSGGGLEYSVLDLGTGNGRHETLPFDLAAPPIGLSRGGLAVNRAGVPGLGVLDEDGLVYLVRDPVWRRVEIPNPLYADAPLVVADEHGFAHLFVGGAMVSQGPDGWTETDVWPGSSPRAFAVRFGVAHAVDGANNRLGLPMRAYMTNGGTVPDSVDRNCDGVDGFDRDGDGHASIRTGGRDCDDHDNAINPDANDVRGDGVDSDCDAFGSCPDRLPGPTFVEVPYGDRNFCIDRTEVTNADYAAFLGSGVPLSSSCQFNETFEPPPAGANSAIGGACPGFRPAAVAPVLCLDWCDAVAYCAWAGKRLCGGSFGRPISGSDSAWRIACDQGFVGIEDLGGVWEWQDGCTPGGGATAALDPCPAYGGRFTTAPAPERCSETLMLGRADVSAIVGFRCCDE